LPFAEVDDDQLVLLVNGCEIDLYIKKKQTKKERKTHLNNIKYLKSKKKKDNRRDEENTSAHAVRED